MRVIPILPPFPLPHAILNLIIANCVSLTSFQGPNLHRQRVSRSLLLHQLITIVRLRVRFTIPIGIVLASAIRVSTMRLAFGALSLLPSRGIVMAISLDRRFSDTLPSSFGSSALVICQRVEVNYFGVEIEVTVNLHRVGRALRSCP